MTPLEKNTIFSHMRAVQRESLRSPIPGYKIGALIEGKDRMGHEFVIQRTNHWPNIIRETLGVKKKIGNSSPTIHAETAVLTASPHAVEGADLYITDPPCPNCMKNIAEAGIKNLYIDQGGFDRKYYKKNKNHVDNISIEIAKRAGISIYHVNTLREEIITAYEAPQKSSPVNDSPIEIEPINKEGAALFDDAIDVATQAHKQRKHVVACVQGPMENKFLLTVRSHLVVGYSAEDKQDVPLINKAPGEKYGYIQEPVNRLLMFMARKGYSLVDGYLYCSIVPTSREQVNLVGAGIKRITIGDIQKSRDGYGLKAMETLKNSEILEYS